MQEVTFSTAHRTATIRSFPYGIDYHGFIIHGEAGNLDARKGKYPATTCHFPDN
jgi:hypothetical protein